MKYKTPDADPMTSNKYNLKLNVLVDSLFPNFLVISGEIKLDMIPPVIPPHTIIPPRKIARSIDESAGR